MLLYNVVDRPELTYASVVGYVVVVIKEGITGLLIGYAASICNSIVLFAGNIIDMDIGLSMSTEFNQDMGTETTLTGNLYYYLVLLLLITSDFIPIWYVRLRILFRNSDCPPEICMGSSVICNHTLYGRFIHHRVSDFLPFLPVLWF